MSFPDSARVAVFLALAAAAGAASGATGQAVIGADTPAVDALFAPWRGPGSPGCALAVARNGELEYSRGYGYANLDWGIGITPQTAFDIGSVTKQFVAASISMLELEGKLSLADDVRRWLPELPDYGRPIRLNHLIYHTSGLRDYLTLFPLAGRDHYHPISLPQILDMMSRQRALNFTPGARSEYSNTGYMMLALVVERASGRTLREFVEERILGPLGMDASLMYDSFETIIPRRATGYDRHGSDDIRMVHNYNFDVPGDGQMYASVEDLLRWDDYLHGSARPDIHALMMERGTLDSGEPLDRARGLYLGEYRGLQTIHHTGSSWGSRAVLMRFVQPGLALAIACNDGLADTLELAHRVADHFLAGELESPTAARDPVGQDPDAPGPPEQRAMSPGRQAEFVGVYHSDELDATYRLAAGARGLTLRVEQQPVLDVTQLGDDEFEFRFADQAYSGVLIARLRFARDDAGAVTGFALGSGAEQGIRFDKRQ